MSIIKCLLVPTKSFTISGVSQSVFEDISQTELRLSVPLMRRLFEPLGYSSHGDKAASDF